MYIYIHIYILYIYIYIYILLILLISLLSKIINIINIIVIVIVTVNDNIAQVCFNNLFFMAINFTAVLAPCAPCVCNFVFLFVCAS